MAGHPLIFRWAPVAYMNGINPLSWDFIGFLCKPRNGMSASFISSILLTSNFSLIILYIYISLSPHQLASDTLDATEAGPQ